MRVPLEWLLHLLPAEFKEKGDSAEEIATRLTMGGLEVEGIEESALGPVLDVYITPNRGDCLSIYGVAREVAALYDIALETPVAASPAAGRDNAAAQTIVTVEDPDLCPRYAARIVRGIKVRSSPAWMQARLEAAGQRPINNIVDVTNYVMLELGQPLHAFDLKKLAGGRIVIRRARDGETLRTLDEEERSLTETILVIADADKPVAVAGVMGGANSEVSYATSDILLESAHFDPLSVRRTSRALGLRTEASYRFERVVDPNGVQQALDRACQLLAEMGQPAAVPDRIDVYPNPIEPLTVTLRVPRAAALLGLDITMEIAADCLHRLGFGVDERADSDTNDSDRLRVTVPTFRSDVTLEEDLIEEVGRIYGYENIPETLPFGGTTLGGDSVEGRLISKIRASLVGAGLQEVVTHSLGAPSFFDAPDDAARRVSIRNALSAEVGGLRRSLLPTMLHAAEHNAAFQQNALALFEVGRVWQNEGVSESVPQEYTAVAGLLVGPLMPPDWQRGKGSPADFVTARGVLEHLLGGLGIRDAEFLPLGDSADAFPQFHPGRSALVRIGGSDRPQGIIGEIHPARATNLALRERVYVFEIGLDALQQSVSSVPARYAPLSRFPAVSRDLAPRVAESLPYAAIEDAIASANIPILETMRLTDVYRGAPLPEGIKSLTLTFQFRSATETLVEGAVGEAMARLRTTLETRCAAVFPS